jgi:hypothetical protein
MAFEDMIDIEGLPVNKANPLGTADKLSISDYKNQPYKAKTWQILKAKYTNYDFNALNIIKQNYLYNGGFIMNEPEVAKLFCKKMRNEEDDTSFKERVQSAAYIPVFSKLITGLTSSLFSQDLSVMEAADHDDKTTLGDALNDTLRDFYKRFVSDCDGAGTNLHNFIREATTEALIHSYNYFGVDYPKGIANSLLEQEQLGLDQPRLYKIHANSVFDYRINPDIKNQFQWIKLVDCNLYQPTAFDPPLYQYTIKVWSMDPSGFAAYQTYQTQPLPKDKEPKPKDLIPLIDEGITSFKQIPIFCFQLNSGISVGAKLAPMAAELFNRTTIENHSTNRACITVPVHYKGNTYAGDSIPDPIMFNSTRGYNPRGKVNSNGIFELGTYNEDRFEIVEAEGKALGFIHKQNEDLEEKMYSVVHQMGQSLKQSRTSGGKSGLSKQEDRRATEMLLTAIADEIFSLTNKVFTTIAESRNENIVWDIKGLSCLASDDRDELTKEASTLSNLQIPSTTFHKEYHYRIASRLIEGTDQRTLQTIRNEIEEGLDTLQLEPGQSIRDKKEAEKTEVKDAASTN